MSIHRVEIKDSRGQPLRVLIHFSPQGPSTWHSLDHGFLRYTSGVVDSGHYPASPLAWIALYGENRIDDSKLVLHLDDFVTDTMVHAQGEGQIYLQDYILAEPGKVTWRLLDG